MLQMSVFNTDYHVPSTASLFLRQFILSTILESAFFIPHLSPGATRSPVVHETNLKLLGLTFNALYNIVMLRESVHSQIHTYSFF